jgi:exodeoxyribonuclease V
MKWSYQQDAAIKAVGNWLHDRRGPQCFRMFGFAGTGKTTIAKEMENLVRGPVLFGAFTGKAALVLRKKGCAEARTIHSLIYTVDEEDPGWEPKFVLSPFSEVKGAGLVVIDECSMVDEKLGRDLLSFGTKVLVIGDPAQLPPVKGAGFFTSAEPDFMLTEVHRQAKDNPIISMATTIREGGKLDHGDYGESRVITREDLTKEMVMASSQILVGRNATRRAYNARMRQLLERPGPLPVEEDKLVCLKNNREKHLLNGGIWMVAKKVRRTTTPTVSLHILPDDAIPDAKTTRVKVRREFFEGCEDNLDWEDRKGTDEFTYGYALTVHKAQGSQWPDVLVFDEGAVFREDARRWRYTALTRAAERVTVVS